MAEGVVDEVADGLLKSQPVDVQQQWPGLGGLDGAAVERCGCRKAPGDRVEKVRGLHRFGLEVEHPLLRSGEQQQVVGEAAESLGLVECGVEDLFERSAVARAATAELELRA